MARRIFFKEQSSLGVAPNGYSIMGFNTSNRAIKTDESGVVRLIESVYTDETNTIVIGASGGTGSVSVNGYYQLPNYTPSSGQVLGLSGSSLHWITSGGGLSGAGTTNYLAKWNSGGLTSSLVYDNGAFVGIGATTVPLASVLLHASKDQASGTSIGISNTNSIGSLGLLFNGNTAGGYTYLSQLNSANTGTRSVNTSLSLSSTFIWAGGDGGTLNPMLIHGDRLVNLNGNNGSGYGFRSDASGFSITRNDATHTPNSSYSSALYVKGSTSDSTSYALKVDNSSSSALLYVRNDGNVGIGTSSPSYKLNVQTNINSFDIGFLLKNTNAGTSAVSSMGVQCDTTGALYLGALSSTNTAYSSYGSAGHNFIYSSVASTGLNIIHAGSNNIRFAFDISLPIVTIQQSNNSVGIVETSPTARLHLKGSTSDNTAYALKVDNSSSSALLYVRNDGYVRVGTTSGNLFGLKADFEVGRSTDGIVWNVITNTSTGSSNRKTQLFYQDDNTYTSLSHYGPNAGAIGWGYAIPNFFVLNNAKSGSTYNSGVIIGGEPIILYNGSSNTDGSAKLDALGLYISSSLDITTNSGNVATARLHVVGSTSDSSTYALKVDNSSSSALLYVRNDGLVTIGDTTTAYANIFSIKKSQSGLLMADIVNTNTTNGSDAVLFIGQTTSKIGNLRYRNANSTASPFSSTLVLADTFQIEATYNGTTGTGNIAYVAAKQYAITGFQGVNGANTMLDQTGFKISSINSGLNSANTNLFEANGGVSYLKGSNSDSSTYALKVDNSSSSALLYVRNDGRVGVNSTPYGRLSVYGNDANNSDNPSGMSVIYQVGASDASLTFAVGSPLVTMWGIGIDNSDSDKFKISTNPTFDLGTSPAITIDPSNLYVGLNQASPSYPLHVVGKINSSVGFVVNGVDGAVSATFATVDGKTVTVSGGIITSVV